MARVRIAVLAAMLVVLLLGGVAGPPAVLRFAAVPPLREGRGRGR